MPRSPAAAAAGYGRPPHSWAVHWPVLKRLVPVCFLAGAAVELFMVQTGFYKIVTRKAGEREAVARFEEQAYWEGRRQRLAARQARIAAMEGDQAAAAAAKPQQ